MSDHDRDRDNATGRFVTDEEADARPESTTSEDVRNPARTALNRILAAADTGDPDQLAAAIKAARQ